MILIQKIALKELDSFINSKIYKELKNKPISKTRAVSYLKNPRANNKDVVLYLAFLNNQLVSYRTILADTFFIENKPTSFGWLSGNWVHKKHRRKGISTLLFNEVLKDWQGKLMYTNYAEASKLVYDKTKQFKTLQELKGTKFYTRFCLADILPTKNKVFKRTKLFWLVLDIVLNLFLDIKNLFKSKVKDASFYVKKDEKWKDSVLEFTNNFISKTLFQRSLKEFNWIHNYPWILKDKIAKEDSKQYHFSLYAKEFDSNMYTIYNTNNCLIGCLLLTVRNGHVKVPYAYFLKENTKEIAHFIVGKCAEMRVKTLVIYQKELEKELNNNLLVVTKKVFNQKYFMTNKLEKSLSQVAAIEIQSGDGDVVFT